jgi:GNAT superfamily N-acetyltransferase
MSECSGGEGQRAAGAEPDAAARDAAPELVGYFYAWWRGDPLPALCMQPRLSIARATDDLLLARLMGAEEAEVRERRAAGHQPWLAQVEAEPVGWGWAGTSAFSIGELNIDFALPPGNHYLWDFVTLPPWRGRGIYPSLLQAILTRGEAERFWIGHDWDNRASARGIAKAGFARVGAAWHLADGRHALAPDVPRERAEAAAALLGLPLVAR